MKIQKIPANSYAHGGTRSLSDVRYIVIHYTGGGGGDTARNNGLYFKGGNRTYAGAHFFVDQYGNVVQSVEMTLTAWSVGGFFTTANGAGKYYQQCLNSNSVSIELCDCDYKDPSPEMIETTRKLIEHIQAKCPHAKTILRHWDVNGKCCPARMAGRNNEKWIKFRAQIQGKSVAHVKTAAAKKKAAYPTSNLHYGSTGEQVKKLQKCLNKIMKAGLTVDGSFGPATLKAVKAFQKKYKLEVDGSVGPQTRSKIKELVSK